MVKRTFSFPQLNVTLIDVKLWIPYGLRQKANYLTQSETLYFCTELYLYLTNLVIRPETQSFPQSCFELST